MRQKAPLLAIVACVSVLAVALLAGCHGTAWNGNNDLVVFNDSHCELTIWLDGARLGVVRPDSEKAFEDVGDGRHTVEARDEQGALVERRQIDLDRQQDYYWRISRC